MPVSGSSSVQRSVSGGQWACAEGMCEQAEEAAGSEWWCEMVSGEKFQSSVAGKRCGRQAGGV